MTMNTKTPTDAELDYRDDRDVAFKYVDNFVRRIKLHVDSQIKVAHVQAALEGREVSVDLSRDGIKRLIAEAAVRQATGQKMGVAEIG